MAMFYRPPAAVTTYHGDPDHPMHMGEHVFEPVTDPEPWIQAALPPDDQKRPPATVPPVVVIEPVEKPPWIAPPPPDMMPETIVPQSVWESIPATEVTAPLGSMPPMRPPATIVAIGAAAGLGTFMVYVGKRLVLTMAASLGTSLGKSAGTMLVGAVSKQLFRGTSIRFHSGQSFGVAPDLPGSRQAMSYEDAWRAVPQEFSYWEK